MRKIPKALLLFLCLAYGISCKPAYVPGEYCEDQYGNLKPKYAGFECCPDGGGQCQEELYCYGADECRGPLPPNDDPGPNSFGVSRQVTRMRSGLTP